MPGRIEQRHAIEGRFRQFQSAAVERSIVTEQAGVQQFLTKRRSAPAKEAGAGSSVSPGLRGPEIDRPFSRQRIRRSPIDLPCLLLHDPGVMRSRFHPAIEIVIDGHEIGFAGARPARLLFGRQVGIFHTAGWVGVPGNEIERVRGRVVIELITQAHEVVRNPAIR